MMEPELLPTELILNHPRQTIGNLKLDCNPQPGSHLEYQGKTYTVLERRHRYQFKSGRYRLHKIAVYVQSTEPPLEQSLVKGRWVLGDASCEFNAHSELVRCAVNPQGPCQTCRHYQSSQLSQ